jgi:Arc/MetJ-type ribon-helix-helix transcriptional regulator
MTIELTPEDQELVEEKLRSGAFRNVGELIHRALVSLPVEPVSGRAYASEKDPGRGFEPTTFCRFRAEFGEAQRLSRPIDL